MKDLKQEIDERLDGFVQGDVYFDRDRIKSGYNIDASLQNAICRSACMVVIYCPEYGNRDYCRREFELMYRINAKRKNSLGESAEEKNFILIVSLVKNKHYPQQIADNKWHISDFSEYHQIPAKGNRRIKNSKNLCNLIRSLSETIIQLNELMRHGEFGSNSICCGENMSSPDSIATWAQEIPFPR